MADKKELSREELEKRLKWYEKKYGVYIEKTGLHNWKNLFKRPTLYECTILFMLLMGLFMGWAYQRDVALCREVLAKQEQGYFIVNYAEDSNNTINSSPPRTYYPPLNLDILNITPPNNSDNINEEN